jgi:hypothetical protein
MDRGLEAHALKTKLEADRRILIIAEMNCPKCRTEAPAGADYCKRCGTALAAKAKAAAAQSESSSSDEIDLMPLDEKKPAYQAYEAPPGLDGGPLPPAGKAAPQGPGPDGPPLDGPVKKIRGANAAPKTLPINAIIGGAIGLILLLGIGWMVLRTKNEVKVGKPKLEKGYLINAGQLFVEDVEVTGVVPYSLEVSVTEGEALVGIYKRTHKDSRKLDAIKGSGELETLKKGDSKTYTGEFKHKEQWSWVVANDTKKPTRLKVKFVTTP